MSNQLKEYMKYRKAGVKLNGEIIKIVDKEAMIKAAKLLHMEERGKIVITEESSTDYLWDFLISEPFQKDESFAAIYQRENPIKKDIDNDILDALSRSYTSLFKVISSDKNECTIEVKDVLNNRNESFSVIDRGFSQTVATLNTDILLFARILPFPTFNMFSGASFTFHAGHEEYLIKRSKKLMKKLDVEHESVKRFIAFYELNKRDGLPTLFETVK